MRRPSLRIAVRRVTFIDGVDTSELRIDPDPWSWIYRRTPA